MTIGDIKLNVQEKPLDGCYVYGLFFDGARWSLDKKYLIEPETNVLFY